MKITNKTIITNWLFLTITLLLAFSAIAIYVAVSGFSNARVASDSFESFYITEHKQAVKQEVQNRLDEIYFERLRLEEEAFKFIEHEIKHIAYVLKGKEISGIENLKERQRLAVLEFEKLAAFDDEHLYFVIDTKGTLLRSGTDNTLEGINLYDNQDVNGAYYAREMLKAVEQDDGVYVTYHWPKVKDGEPLKKTSYCYYIPIYDIIIGTGEYFEDIEAQLQERVYERLLSYYKHQENYIFVNSYDGMSIVTADPEQVGQDMAGVLNHDGTSAHETIMTILEDNEEGYTTYTYYKKNGTQLLEKISYITKIEGWDAYIGMGFYTEDLKGLNDAFNDQFKTLQYTQIFVVIISLVLVAVTIFILIQRGNKLQQIFLQQEELLFTDLFEQINEGILILGNDKVLYANARAHQYFNHDFYRYIRKGQLELSHVGDDVRIIYNDDTTYYTEITTDNIQYKGIDATIYFIKNVTSQYLQANEFQKMSLIDELTSLPNRRALINDFDPSEFSNTSRCVLGIIDLDHFKNINDTYGHSMGDKVLCALGDAFSERLRHGDKLYRYGGEEFIIILREISPSVAHSILSEINLTFSNQCLKAFGFNQTFSAGLTEHDCANYADCNIDDVINRADELLYKAKEKGRNRIEY